MNIDKLKQCVPHSKPYKSKISFLSSLKRCINPEVSSNGKDLLLFLGSVIGVIVLEEKLRNLLSIEFTL